MEIASVPIVVGVDLWLIVIPRIARLLGVFLFTLLVVIQVDVELHVLVVGDMLHAVVVLDVAVPVFLRTRGRTDSGRGSKAAADLQDTVLPRDDSIGIAGAPLGQVQAPVLPARGNSPPKPPA